LGSQRPPTSQWTVTGAGASIISSAGKPEDPKITYVTTGKPMDYGISDANNMGAAMAPAALDTIIAHLKETQRDPKFYDLIITGDLGIFGKSIVIDLAKQQEYDLSSNYTDCGVEVFDAEKQGVDMGGSGCGCSASVFNGYLMKKMRTKEINKLLFIATGALMSPLCIQQGESIVGIAHAVAIENMN
jgi:stage V sporulation protein AD